MQLWFWGEASSEQFYNRSSRVSLSSFIKVLRFSSRVRERCRRTSVHVVNRLESLAVRLPSRCKSGLAPKLVPRRRFWRALKPQGVENLYWTGASGARSWSRSSESSGCAQGVAGGRADIIQCIASHCSAGSAGLRRAVTIYPFTTSNWHLPANRAQRTFFPSNFSLRSGNCSAALCLAVFVLHPAILPFLGDVRVQGLERLRERARYERFLWSWEFDGCVIVQVARWEGFIADGSRAHRCGNMTLSDFETSWFEASCKCARWF